MKEEQLKEAVKLSEKSGYVVVATTAAEMIPHIAVAGKLEFVDSDRVAVVEWFCPETVTNLQTNKRISIVVWDKRTDCGYQLTGQSERIEDIGVMNGFAADVESDRPLPQIQRQVLVRIEKVMDFKLGPHNDVEL